MSVEDIVKDIRGRLAIVDSEMNTDIGTPIRKVIDAVAGVLAENSIDKYILDYQFDIEQKSGSDLDNLLELFGFARQEAKCATGTVTFSRVGTEYDVEIPIGTQVYKSPGINIPAIYFRTTGFGILTAGESSIDIPIQAILAGTSGNVSATTLTSLGGDLPTVTAVSNIIPTSGGADVESDEDLRVRFRKTVFRNLAGTRDQYLALCLAHELVSRGTVTGPVSRYTEQLTIINGSSTSQLVGSKYTYLGSGILWNQDSNIYYIPGEQYSMNTNVPPTITVLNNAIANNSVVVLEHEYCSNSSRNDPSNSKFNCVDIFINGQDGAEAIDQLFRSSIVFTDIYYGINSMNRSNWLRDGTSTEPSVNNYFEQLMWSPVLSLPSTITITVSGSPHTLVLGTDYWLIHDVTNLLGSCYARDGIELQASSLTSVPPTSPYSVTYQFNKLPLELTQLLLAYKQVTSDVLVHRAKDRFLTVNLTMMYTLGYSFASVDAAVSTALSKYFSGLDFLSWIQFSDILEQAQSVTGVDNVRIATSSDNTTNYGIQEVSGSGSVIGTYIKDFLLEDNDLPVLYSTSIIVKTANNW